VNAACVPRHRLAPCGTALRQLTWVELDSDGRVLLAAHRWYSPNGELAENHSLTISGAVPW
jgi:hypothetical protein